MKNNWKFNICIICIYNLHSEAVALNHLSFTTLIFRWKPICITEIQPLLHILQRSIFFYKQNVEIQFSKDYSFQMHVFSKHLKSGDATPPNLKTQTEFLKIVWILMKRKLKAQVISTVFLLDCVTTKISWISLTFKNISPLSAELIICSFKHMYIRKKIRRLSSQSKRCCWCPIECDLLRFCQKMCRATLQRATVN